VTADAGRFEAFSGQHYLLLGIFVVGAVAIVMVGRSQRRRLAEAATPGFSRVLAVAVASVAVLSLSYRLLPVDFELQTSLPLQLCDFAWITATWALWTRARVPVALTYYWGLTLSVQGIITPSLGQQFPNPRFFAFWALHFLVVWSALYLSIGLRLGPRWREYRITVAVTVVWAVVVYWFDKVVGLNYGYLVHKPPSASLFDLFGPWPWYMLVSIALVLGVWALMTLPWVSRRPAAAG
jgi:hypothetical integral membrane protein (TIGR02206 family)